MPYTIEISINIYCHCIFQVVSLFFATLDILTPFGSPNLLKGPLQLPDSYNVYTKMYNAK